MFHRSYLPSTSFCDDEHDGGMPPKPNDQHHFHEDSHSNARSCSLDFELYSPRSPSNLHEHYNNDRHRRNSTSAAVYHDDGDDISGKQEQLIQWFLLQSRGPISFRLSTQQPILIGSGSECDIRFLHQQRQSVSSPTSSTTAAAGAPVEKRHAVLAFEPNSNCFTVRDLNTTNGTYVNNRRLCGDHPETVSNLDVLRFGYDIHFIHPSCTKATDASLSTAAGIGAGGGGPSSLPPTLNNYSGGSSNKTGGYNNGPFSSHELESEPLSRSISTEDNLTVATERRLPPKGFINTNNTSGAVGAGSVTVKKFGGSPFLPRKSLLTKKNSDPGGVVGIGDGNSSISGCGGSSAIFSERLAQFQRRSSGGNCRETLSPAVAGYNLGKQCGDRFSGQQQQHSVHNVMQQGGRSGTSGVCSPSLTLDSGRGSSSAPSSPAKEMSPVQMMAATAPTPSNATSPTGVVGGGAGGSSIGTTSSSQSHNASPVFARKLSRPMEYLLGQQQQQSPTNETSSTDDPHFVVDPHYSVGLSSGNYTSFCSGSEPISFATSGSCGSSGTSTNYNLSSPVGRSGSRNVDIGKNTNNNLNSGFPSDCEILQITEDFDNDHDEEDDVVARKDSLEEDEDSNQNVMLNGGSDFDNGAGKQQQPQFLVGGDIMQPDLNVPNEVFGPLSHAEILSRNNPATSAYKNINVVNQNNNANLNSQHSSGGKQGNNKPVLVEGYTNHAPRARSSSGDGGNGGGSNRSTPLSALYGTPHWWPDSPPPEENCCPPPPASSTNSSPFKKPFLLNANNRLKGNSLNSSLADPVKDLSLESAHSQKSTSSSSPATTLLPSSSSLDGNSRNEIMTSDVKKLTPMAFTIDFGDGSESGGTSGIGGGAATISEAAEAKKAAIAERLSKFAPRHKRNASLTKSDDVVVGTTETSVAASTSSLLPKQTKSSNVGSNSLGRTQQHQQRQSSVSTGAAESSSKCASLPKKLSSSSGGVAGGSASIAKHPSGGSNNDSGLRSLSPETISSTTSSSSRSRPLIDSKSVHSSVANNNIGSMGRKSGGSNTTSKNQQSSSRGGTPASRRITPSDGLRSTYHQHGEKADNINSNKLNDLSKGPTITPPAVPTPLPVIDKEDTVSEAGTYTVEKEIPDVQTARESIEHVFGLNGDDEEMDKENNLVHAARASSCEANKSFSGVGSAEPGTRDWVREWAELAAQQHQQKKHSRPELPDSQYFLRETETLVSAIQERVSKHMKSGGGGGSASLGPADSDSDDDEPTLSHHTPVKSQSQHSTPTNTGKRRPPSRTSPFHRESSVLSDSGYAIGYQSDSSNEGSSSATTHNIHQTRGRGSEPLVKSHHGILTNKMNRAFNIRRGGRNFGYESTSSSKEPLLMMNNQQSKTTLPLNNTRGISPKPAQVNSLTKCNNVGANDSSSSSPHFARNDGGRFSLRMSKSRTPPAQMPPPAPRQTSYSGGASGDSHTTRVMMNGHSKSESREQSVSSSGGGSKKYTVGGKVLNTSGVVGSNKKTVPGGGNRSNSTLTAKEVELANWKRRKNYDPMKAAAEGKKGSKKNGVSTSSGAESGVEESTALPPIASPQVNRREAMMTKSLSFHQESYSPKCPSEDEDMIYIVDELDSSHSNSPNHLGGGVAAMTRSYHEDVMYYGMSGSAAAMRPKNKLEALDNLVIATIHSLSNKVRTSSRHLLEKLQTQHTNDENGALLEEMVSQLKELEGPSNNSSPNKSPSRELSGTLKNLKKLEQVILVLDKVLCDGFESDVNG